MATRHTSKADGKGWLVVKLYDGSTTPALPQLARIGLNKNKTGRDYFIVIEGPKNDTNVSVKRREGDGSYLLDGDPTESISMLRFDRRIGRLCHGGIRPVAALPVTSTPISLASCDIEIPGEANIHGAVYQEDSITF
jgi:hypothetical protein